MESLLHIHLLDSGGFIQRFISWIIDNGGLYFLLFVIFAETGLVAYLWPLFIVLFSGFLPGERLRPLHLIGALTALSSRGSAKRSPACGT